MSEDPQARNQYAVNGAFTLGAIQAFLNRMASVDYPCALVVNEFDAELLGRALKRMRLNIRDGTYPREFLMKNADTFDLWNELPQDTERDESDRR